tara:strand:+ start:2135 stop:2368 length:234 start_codon:yes stop_codon:yes gene_type:complete
MAVAYWLVRSGGRRLILIAYFAEAFGMLHENRYRAFRDIPVRLDYQYNQPRELLTPMAESGKVYFIGNGWNNLGNRK